MSHLFPSEPWAVAYKDAINDNPAYAEAGKDWTHGAVALVVKAAPELDLDKDMAIVVDVHAGECRSTTYTDAESARESAPFVVEGLYDRWQTIIVEGLDPIKALMQGKLKLSKGHLPTIIRYVESSKQLLASAKEVSTEFRK